MTSEERANWQTLVMTLRRYSASKTFGPLLASYNFDLSMTAMKQMTVPQLEDVLDRARICCQNSTMTGMFGEAAISCVGLVEQGVTRSPLGKRLLLQGLTESVRNDSSFMTALEQCSIDYGCSWACRPEYRLLMSFVAAAGRTHAVNAFLKVRGEAVEGEDPGDEPPEEEAEVPEAAPGAESPEEPAAEAQEPVAEVPEVSSSSVSGSHQAPPLASVEAADAAEAPPPEQSGTEPPQPKPKKRRARRRKKASSETS
jgi:hypothetical protein